jgi:putative ABC transport system permease protein
MGTWNDVRHALRLLVKSPGFTIVAVLTLALGIGANAAIFSVVNSVLLEALPFPHANRLIFLHEHSSQVHEMSIDYPDFQDWQRQQTVLDPLGAFQVDSSFVLTGAGEPQQIQGFNASAGFLPALGVKPILGRLFGKSDDRPGAAQTTVISYAMWQRKFGGDPGAIGRTLDLNGNSFTIIGVLPASFHFLIPADVFLPLGLNADKMQDRGNHPGILAIGRLKPGVTIERARTEMGTIMARLARQYPRSNAGVTATVETLRDAYYGYLSGLPTALWVLLAAVGFVLLIACANVANLLLARGAGRERELAVRVALGAGRSRLVRQMLTESVILALVGGLGGLLLGAAGTSALEAMIPADLASQIRISMDWHVLVFLLAITVLTGVIFGIAPAWRASRTDVNESLKEGGRSGTAGVGRSRYRQALVVSEFALGLVLVVASALMILSFYRLLQVNPGFRVNRILTAEVSLPNTKYPKDAQITAFYRDALARIHSLPGVQAAGAIMPLPLTGNGWQTSVYIEGRPVPKPGQAPESDYHSVTPGYFSAMGPRLLRGRLFTAADDANSPRVALVSRSFAELFWPHQDPIGKRMKVGGYASKHWTTVVGEVADTKQYGLDKKTKTEFYLPQNQEAFPAMMLVVRTGGGASALTSAVRAAVAEVDSQQPISHIRTMRSYLDQNVSGTRMAATLLGLFAALGLLLAGIGIYGVIAYTVSMRTHEIGIRMALGASRGEILRMVLAAGARMALVGVGIGVVLGLGLMRLVSSLLYGVKPGDPLIYVLAAIALTGIALVACYVPARRAMKIAPSIALRYE